MSAPTVPSALSTRLHRMAAWVRGHESYTRRRIADDLERLAGEYTDVETPPTPAQLAAAEAAFTHVLENHGVTVSAPLTLALRAALNAR